MRHQLDKRLILEQLNPRKILKNNTLIGAGIGGALGGSLGYLQSAINNYSDFTDKENSELENYKLDLMSQNPNLTSDQVDAMVANHATVAGDNFDTLNTMNGVQSGIIGSGLGAAGMYALTRTNNNYVLPTPPVPPVIERTKIVPKIKKEIKKELTS